jgi:nucleotide-binding universal stress UspA family protein
MEDAMAYKTILVSLNEIPRVPQLLAAATKLARTYEAHVTGLYVIPAVQIYPSVGYEAIPQYFDGNQIYFKDHAKEVSDAFDKAMKAEALSGDVEVVNGASANVADEVVARGHSADLILVSATTQDAPAGVEPDFVEQTVINSGRPVIVLPVHGEAALDANQIIVAWNGGREATRAAFDSLPLLQTASKVFVTRIDPQKQRSLKNRVPGIDLAEMLARHGIKTEVSNLPTSGEDPGTALLTAAADWNAGLIVMGAYGHSRLREFIFGGTTRHMLAHMNRPVLMSH